ncbi:MAG: HTTM domain-containing protein [Cytophagales bacterium]|nr:HTTM domain-containing protein [Cytophagales bacterium]
MIEGKTPYQKLVDYLERPVSIAPLVTFRIAFGLVMLFSTIRYMWMGWVDTQLVEPALHFSYFGFDWVAPLSQAGIYSIFCLMCIAAIGLAIGWQYRFSTILFFLCFTYVELIDITFYLNHYYFVSIVAFLLIWVPAHRNYSIDTFLKPHLRRTKVPAWCVGIFKLQIAIVYCYAGLAKINYDWLFRALPLAIWLPAKSSMPLIGWFFQFKLTAFVFSWAGMLFDTFIIGGLLWRKTRLIAYAAIVIFHLLTGLLFQIGVFPAVMIMVVTVFFSAEWHERLLQKISQWIPFLAGSQNQTQKEPETSARVNHSHRLGLLLLGLFFTFQILFPWRYLLYPGNLFWTEEGYRFAWRVMLMEKAGTATFYVKDSETGREGSVINQQFLHPHQEKQMAMQPDMILQYAQFLKEHYAEKGVNDPQVRAEVWVTLNARPAQLLIDPHTDLTQIKDGWSSKNWILPYPNQN